METLIILHWIVQIGIGLFCAALLAVALAALFWHSLPLSWLYAVRNKIDRRVPRDMLIVQIRTRAGIVLAANHHELIMLAQQEGGISRYNIRDPEHPVEVVFAHQYLSR